MNDKTEPRTPEIDRLEMFKLYRDLVFQEQAFYWQRFSGIAALQAGLIVLSISSSSLAREAIDVFGLALGLLWIYILTVSRWYVDRYKPEFHRIRRSLGIEFEAPATLSNPRFSSTDAARGIAFLITALWFAKLVADLWVRNHGGHD